MARDTAVDSRQEILRTAARLFQQRGYDATSMNDVAAATRRGSRFPDTRTDGVCLMLSRRMSASAKCIPPCAKSP